MSAAVLFPDALAGGRLGLELRLALTGIAAPCELLQRAMDDRCRAALDALTDELVAALMRRPAALMAAAEDARQEVLRAVRAAHGEGAPAWRVTDDSQTQALLPFIAWGAIRACRYFRGVSAACGVRGSDRHDRAAHAALRLWERAEDVSLWSHTSRAASTGNHVDLAGCFERYELAEAHAGMPPFVIERTVRMHAVAHDPSPASSPERITP